MTQFLMQEDRFIDCNSRAIGVRGAPAGTQDQIVGHAPYELSPPQQPGGRASRDLASEKITTGLSVRSQFFEWMHTRCDGTLFPAEVSLNRMELGGRVLLQAIVRNIAPSASGHRRRWRRANSGTADWLRTSRDLISSTGMTPMGVFAYVSESVTAGPRLHGRMKACPITPNTSRIILPIKRHTSIPS